MIFLVFLHFRARNTLNITELWVFQWVSIIFTTSDDIWWCDAWWCLLVHVHLCPFFSFARRRCWWTNSQGIWWSMRGGTLFSLKVAGNGRNVGLPVFAIICPLWFLPLTNLTIYSMFFIFYIAFDACWTMLKLWNSMNILSLLHHIFDMLGISPGTPLRRGTSENVHVCFLAMQRSVQNRCIRP